MKITSRQISSELIISFVRLKVNMAIFRFKQFLGRNRTMAAIGTTGVYAAQTRPLLDDELIIFAGVPYDDVGGGQRSAQIARCALKSGRRVFYIFAYPKMDVSTGLPLESNVTLPLLVHVSALALTPAELFAAVSIHATVLFELPHRLFLPFLTFARCRGVRTFYELIDDWETSLGASWFDYEINRQFVRQADKVAGTARVLQEVLKQQGRDDAMYLPNAANEKIFGQYNCYMLPQEYVAYDCYRYRFIYFGSLYGEWFGWDYLRQAANENLDCGFFLIGECGDIHDLPHNIHLLGAREIDELPAYLAHADAALLPFIPGKISDAVSPIKVFEYLFMGKRVIATPLPEIAGFPGVFTASDPKAYAALCTELKGTDMNSGDTDRFISLNCWNSRIAAILPPLNGSGNVTAVFLIHNNRGIIERALESLYCHCQPFLKEVIVVDNVSLDGAADVISRRFPDVRILKNEVNGCSSGRNLALGHATGEFIAFFDSDQWFTSGSFLSEALAILRNHAAVGAVGWAAGWFDERRGDLSGPTVDDLPFRAMDSKEAVSLGFRTDVAYLGSGGLIVPRVIVQQTAGFDTGYDPTCFEDTDFSFQLKKLGYLLAYRDLTGILHQPHQTTNARSGSPVYLRRLRTNEIYFKKKWAEFPSFFIDYYGDNNP